MLSFSIREEDERAKDAICEPNNARMVTLKDVGGAGCDGGEEEMGVVDAATSCVGSMARVLRIVYNKVGFDFRQERYDG